ncbi:glycosyltransferase family 2 protein [Lysinimonas soli]|uniref:Glycosyltransferase family 2 protein n=1 Tax=Lysinimonas soli TaxID=1074233 RepID=A0ABW0NNB5_9MICO
MATTWKNKPYRGRRRADTAPLARKVENSAVESPTLLLFVLIAAIGVLAYTGFLLNPSNRGDWLPYGIVITAELILVTQALVSMWTILSGGQDPRTFAFHHSQERLFDATTIERSELAERPHDWPMYLENRRIRVDVYITVFGEPLEKIAKTAMAALAMRGQHVTWILDDGESDAVRDLAADLGVRYVRRLTHHGAKAGNINHALTVSNGEYFVVFDADFVPDKDFLYETVPFFIDDKVAFVQTPQAYGNLHNLISRGAGFMQTVFYRFIQPGRNRFNAAFSVGTNVIFRRSAIEQIGGMVTDSKSEDVWTSLRLHERGWRSIYIAVTLAVGDAPETIEAYTKQQLRWASGGFEILMQRNPFSPRTKLTIDQRIQYFVTATHYLVGITPLLLIMVPPLEIYFDLRPVNLTVTWLTWLLFYAGFYGIQVLLAFHTMGSFRPETLIMAAVSFPIYVRAFVNVFSGREQKWSATGSKRDYVSPFNFIIPQVLFFVFVLLTSLVGIVKDYSHQTITLATAWNVTNTIVLGTFIVAAFRESHRARAVEAPRATFYPTFARPVSERPIHSIPAPVPVRARAASEAERLVPVFDQAGRTVS